LIWLAKIVTGVLVFALLLLHLVVNHLVAAGGLLTYADVLAYYANPIIPVIEGFFLVFVVSHALLGVRGITLDLNPTARFVRAFDVVLWMIGATAVGYGVWLLWVVAGRAG
jgi:succinate dehydrogenase / fumarate reductase membrane anchor subunit